MTNQYSKRKSNQGVGREGGKKGEREERREGGEFFKLNQNRFQVKFLKRIPNVHCAIFSLIKNYRKTTENRV